MEQMCDCNNSPIYVPIGNEWGAKIWLLLHTLSRRAGAQTDPLAQRDEMIAWRKIIQGTGNILPCPDCKGHYNTWLAERKTAVTDFPKLSYTEQVEFVQHWFVDLHNDINLRLGKSVFTFDEYLEHYKDIQLNNTLYELGQILKLYTQVSGYLASPAAFAEWKKHIVFLLSQV
jgi:Erv1 / Alr family